MGGYDWIPNRRLKFITEEPVFIWATGFVIFFSVFIVVYSIILAGLKIFPKSPKKDSGIFVLEEF